MCIDVLCSLARMPAEPEPAADEPQRLAEWHAAREVPRTILRTITAHLRADGAEVSWHGHDFDLHGVKIDRHVDFRGFTFNDGTMTFDDAEILPDGFLDFEGASFSGGVLNLARATLHHPVIFTRAVFSGGVVQADKINIDSAGFLVFTDATFSGTNVQLDDSGFTGGIADLSRATFKGGRVSFCGARFSGSNVGFNMAAFVGGDVAFHEAQFTGGTVDLSNPEVWSAPPKGLPDPVPAQLKLPSEERLQWCATVGQQRYEDQQDESSTKQE